MGFDVARFPDQQVSSHLRCFLCGLVLQDPRQTPECEHLFCASCISNWLLNNSTCPHYHMNAEEDNVSVKSEKIESGKKKSPLRKMSFRKIIGKSKESKDTKETVKDLSKLPQIKSEDLRQAPEATVGELNQLRIRCGNSDKGCDQVLSISQLPVHMEECTFTSSPPLDMVKETNEENEAKSSDPTLVPEVGSEEGDVEKNRKNSSVSEDREEIASDDFVVVPKGSRSDKSTGNEHESTGDSVSDKVINEDGDKAAEKKKKKKKKKKPIAKKEDDTVSQKEESATNSDEEQRKIKPTSPSHTSEFNELRKTVGSLETQLEEYEKNLKLQKSEKDRLEDQFDALKKVNTQLLTQIKTLQREKEEQRNASSSQEEIEELKKEMTQLKQENQLQAHQIHELLTFNIRLSKVMITMREQELEYKSKLENTICRFSQAARIIQSNAN